MSIIYELGLFQFVFREPLELEVDRGLNIPFDLYVVRDRGTFRVHDSPPTPLFGGGGRKARLPKFTFLDVSKRV